MTADGVGRPVTLINVFEVAAADVAEFIEKWQVRAAIMASAPGFRDARLHRAMTADARFQLVNVAHWDSAEHWMAAQSSPAFVASLKELRAEVAFTFTANPAIYETVTDLA